MFMFWFLNDSNLYQKNNLSLLYKKKSYKRKKGHKLNYWRIGWKPIISHVFPKEGDMVLKEQNHKFSDDFFRGAFDLKKHVFINLRKQIRQKMEGVSAS